MIRKSGKSHKRAIIVGGGIGGLATGIALKRIGIQPFVFERAAEIRPVGAGISLWSNAIMGLDRMGLSDDVIRRGSIIRRGRMIKTNGKLISMTDIAALSAEAGYPSIMIHRGDLQDALVAGLGRDSLRLGHEFESFTEHDKQVVVRFKNGEEVTGDFLIGADGIHSAVRSQLLGDSPLRYSGVMCWRGISRCDHPDVNGDMSTVAITRGLQMGILSCGSGRVYWFLAKRDRSGGVNSEAGAKADALSCFGQPTLPLLNHVIRATPEHAIFRTDLNDRAPVWPWGSGRITFVGDSIHPMTPNLGQGGCQAIEDAVYLADSIGSSSDGIEAALRHYEERRRERTAFLTGKSLLAGRVLKMNGRLGVFLRDWFMSRPSGKRYSLASMKQAVLHELPDLRQASSDRLASTV